MVDFFDLARAGGAAIRLAELLVAEGSKLVGQTVDQLCGSAIALLIRRAGGELLPDPSRHTVVESGERGGDVRRTGHPSTLGRGGSHASSPP